MSNKDLWEEWTASLEQAASDPRDRNARQREDRLSNEIVRRLKEAGKKC